VDLSATAADNTSRCTAGTLSAYGQNGNS